MTTTICRGAENNIIAIVVGCLNDHGPPATLIRRKCSDCSCGHDSEYVATNVVSEFGLRVEIWYVRRSRNGPNIFVPVLTGRHKCWSLKP